MKTDSGPNPFPAGSQGGNLIYTITLHNTGPNPETHISFDDTVPAHTHPVGFTFDSADSTVDGSVAMVTNIPANPGDSASASIDHLNANDTAVFKLTVSVDSDAYIATANGDPNATPPLPAHTIRNDVAYRDDQTIEDTGPIPHDLDTIDDLPISSQSDLGVAITTDKASPITAGQNFQYIITADNGGPSDFVNPVVNFALSPADSHVTVVSVDQIPAGWNFTTPPTVGGSPNFVATTSDFSSVAPGNNAVFKITVHVASGTPAETIHSTASITNPGPSGGDNNPTDNNVTNDMGVTALPAPDIAITKTRTSAATAVAGKDDISYSITVQNKGTQAAGQQITLSDMLPAGTSFGSFTANAGNPDNWTIQPLAPNATSGTVTATIADLPANSGVDTFTFTVHVLATTTPGTVVSNSANVTIVPTEQIPQNNTSATINTTVAAQADLAVTKDDGIPFGAVPGAVPGTNDTYTITVTNNGPSAIVATNEQQLINVGGTTGNFQLTFNGAMTPTPGFSVTSATLGMDIQNALNNLSTIKTPAGGGTGSVTVSPTGGGTAFTVTFGGALANQDVHQITANPSGGATASTSTIVNGEAGVNITDHFPSDFVPMGMNGNPPVHATGTNGATGFSDIPDSAQSKDIVQVVSLPVGATVTYTVTGKINSATTAATLTNTVTATMPSDADGNTQVLDTNINADATQTFTQAKDIDNLTPQSEVSITVVPNPSPVQPNQPLTYTITITKTGPSDSGQVTFNTTVPTNATFLAPLDLSGAAGWSETDTAVTGSPSGTAISASVADMAPGSPPAVIIMKVTAGASPSNTTHIVGDFMVGNAIDTTPNDNTKHVDVLISQPLPDLVVSKMGSPSSVNAGQNITYTLTVTNNGQGTASGVELDDTIPANTTAVSFSKTGGSGTFSTSTSGGVAKATGGTLAIGASATFQLVVKVNASDTANITNKASVKLTGTELDTTNNDSQTITTTVTTLADVGVSKTAAVTPNIVVGTQETYTITVTNTGPSNAANVQLTDVIPANTTFFSFSQTSGQPFTISPLPAKGGTGTVSATPTATANSPTGSLAPTGSTPAVFQLVVTVGSNVPTGTPISNTANVSTTTNQGTNTNSDSSTVMVTALAKLDFGDAPASYGTLLADNGPRHIIVGTDPLRLGAIVDSEINGQPSANADLEADDDGVTLPGALLRGREATIIVNVNGISNSSGIAKLDAWLDFGHDGTFDNGDRIATSFDVMNGDNYVSFLVPANAVLGQTFARFRLSTAGGLGPTGVAANNVIPDGEVEDYAVQISPAPAAGTVGIVHNPEQPGQDMLDIEGTPNADSITVTQLRSWQLLVSVSMDGKTYGPFKMSDFYWIVIHGGAGNDTIHQNVSRPDEIDGEDGNDTIYGGGGKNELFGGNGDDTLVGGKYDNVLVGGAGNDKLTGGAGLNVLIGGTGVDRLSGGSKDNILIGGSTVYGDSHTLNDAILALWEAPTTFQQRTNDLYKSPLSPTRVIDDGVKDTLTGNISTKAPNWFIDYSMTDARVNFNPKKDRLNNL